MPRALRGSLATLQESNTSQQSKKGCLYDVILAPLGGRTRRPHRLRLAASAAAICIVCVQAAAADDMNVTKAPPIPYVGSSDYNWNGFDAGGNMGIAWGRSKWTAGPGLSGTSNLFKTINTFDEAGIFITGLQGGYIYVLPNRILFRAQVDASFPAFQTCRSA